MRSTHAHPHLRTRPGAFGKPLDRTGAPEVHMIEAHYLLARLQHDREWLTSTARRIQARELAWP